MEDVTEWYLTHEDYVRATRTFVANMVSRYISKGGHIEEPIDVPKG